MKPLIKKSMLLVLFILGVMTAKAMQTWHLGNIQLKNGKVLTGKLYFQANQQKVYYLSTHNVRSFSARQVEHFEMSAGEFRAGKKYVSLSTGDKSSDSKFEFYEVLASGKLTLLHRQKSVKRRSIKKSPDIHLDQFFYRKEDAVHHYLNCSIKKICELMADQAQRVSNYIKVRSLNLNSRDGIKEVFEYYNSLYITS